jgi:hypothetical protein
MRGLHVEDAVDILQRAAEHIRAAIEAENLQASVLSANYPQDPSGPLKYEILIDLGCSITLFVRLFQLSATDHCARLELCMMDRPDILGCWLFLSKAEHHSIEPGTLCPRCLSPRTDQEPHAAKCELRKLKLQLCDPPEHPPEDPAYGLTIGVLGTIRQYTS